MSDKSNNYFQYSREEMLKFIPEGSKISLEVGCGTGNFSKNLKEIGIKVWGVEPDHESFLVAVDCLDTVFHGNFEEVYNELPPSKFDVIIFNDVLEHMVNPWEVLRMSKSLLSQEGVIVASIPNFLYFHDFSKFLFDKNFEYQQAGIFDKTHLRFFTKKSIIAMFNELDYKLVSIEGIHPTDSRKFKLFNFLTFGYYEEMKYLQYGIKAKPLS